MKISILILAVLISAHSNALSARCASVLEDGVISTAGEVAACYEARESQKPAPWLVKARLNALKAQAADWDYVIDLGDKIEALDSDDTTTAQE